MLSEKAPIPTASKTLVIAGNSRGSTSKSPISTMEQPWRWNGTRQRKQQVNVIRDASDRDRSEQTLEINGTHCGLSLVVVVRRSDALLNCLRLGTCSAGLIGSQTKMPNGSVGRRRKAPMGIDAEILDFEDPLHSRLLQRS